jgi:hypothetical protein
MNGEYRLFQSRLALSKAENYFTLIGEVKPQLRLLKLVDLQMQYSSTTQDLSVDANLKRTH